MKDTAAIMGIQFPKRTLEESVDLLRQVVEEPRSELFHVVTVNPEITMACQKNSELRSIVEEAGMITADGIGIVMVSRIKGDHLPERVTGYDMLLQLLAAGNEKGWSFYFLGADPVTNPKACEVIRSTYPNLKICGNQHGFFKPEDEERIITEISSARPDFLIVALGAPYAERWIHQYKDKLQAKIAIGVGGSLDVIAGKVKQTPEVWKRWNVEWLYRLIQQPHRWRRQLILPQFAIRAILYREGRK
ncbi:WecB/TagA/CpsF family glycosyltransferase [Paenibacillus guangzhouensis]|uniref:WecB/TagA/CpsF family glycosyltransferase n=1 Tax=Paenibacillus guangzhouensis TaxID=1473112 RepID=UPI0012677F9A|nr:WecB/TagA/CpsF family glycosyltransferase [Paenibacillus guangzhouensis]